MKEIVRVRCPCCGMMPSLDNLEQAQNEKPAEIRIFIQRIRGKKPAPEVKTPELKRKRRGSAPGWIDYEDVTEQSADQVLKLKEFFDQRIAEFQGK